MRIAGNRLALAAALLGLVLATLSVPVPAQAQSVALSVNVPFAFHVGNKTLPAGTYTVLRQGEAIQISGTNGHNAFVLSNSEPNQTPEMDSQLVFNRYGDDCFLSEVRWNGYRSSRGIAKSSTETALAKAQSVSKVLTAGINR